MTFKFKYYFSRSKQSSSNLCFITFTSIAYFYPSRFMQNYALENYLIFSASSKVLE